MSFRINPKDMPSKSDHVSVVGVEREEFRRVSVVGTFDLYSEHSGLTPGDGAGP